MYTQTEEDKLKTRRLILRDRVEAPRRTASQERAAGRLVRSAHGSAPHGGNRHHARAQTGGYDIKLSGESCADAVIKSPSRTNGWRASQKVIHSILKLITKVLDYFRMNYLSFQQVSGGRRGINYR